ncbi:MAG: sugar transferase [Candidatus Marithrix sp.]
MFKQILDRDTSKRIFDIAVASFGLAVFAPVVTTIAVVIYLEDQGPILFTQERIGHNRQPFKIFKFRSMNEQEVTKVGKWLRETGLDEIPQFLNVLRGDMSMVGPRPLTEEDIERLGWNQADYDSRWDLIPGITGLAQLRSKGNANSSYRLDMAYQRHSSLLLDSELIFFSLLGNVLGKKRMKRFLSVVK